jgi:hypothetical protein
MLVFIGSGTACLDSHHAPYGVVASGENDGELIGLSVAGDFQFFHAMLLAGHQGARCFEARAIADDTPDARSGAFTRPEARAVFRRRSEMRAPTKKHLLPNRLRRDPLAHHARFAE